MLVSINKNIFKEKRVRQNSRELLLDSAFKEFYKNGYQGANIATILKEVNMNKGSLYHFFKSKKELGLAVIEERIERNLITKYTEILEKENRVETLFKVLIDAPKLLVYGCPLNKMSQEMLYIDKDFKKTLSSTYKKFNNSIESILLKGMQNNEINRSSAELTAQLIIATYEGALMIYHLNQNKEQYDQILTILKKNLFTHKGSQ